jgi:hypothetical protein
LLILVDAVDAVVKPLEMNEEEGIGGRAIKGWVVGGYGEMMVGGAAVVSQVKGREGVGDLCGEARGGVGMDGGK